MKKILFAALLMPLMALAQTYPLSPANGGTGVANAGTITLGGNLTTSGANSLTLTTTGATNVTLPTSGALVSGAAANAWAGTQTFSNSTYSALFTGGPIGVGTSTPSVAFNLTSPSGTPTVGWFGGVAGSATLGQLNDGSLSSPHTALTPSFAITRNEATSSSTIAGNSPALWVETVSHNTGTGNPNGNALQAFATQYGTGDIVGITGQGVQDGTSGHYAYGGYFDAQANVSNSNAYAIETVTDNGTGSNAPLTIGSTPGMVGIHINPNGSKNSTSALWISNDTGGAGAQWDSGLYFSAGSVISDSIVDASNSATSLLVQGAHGFGLNFSAATFTSDAILTPGFAVTPAGTVASSVLPGAGGAWTYDATGSHVTIASGGNTTMAAGNGLLIVHDSVNNENAIYLCSTAACNLVSAIGTVWASPTTSPAAGHLSVSWNGGSGYAIYNNVGTPETVNVSSFRMNTGS